MAQSEIEASGQNALQVKDQKRLSFLEPSLRQITVAVDLPDLAAPCQIFNNSS
jgi:hypothetical protein